MPLPTLTFCQQHFAGVVNPYGGTEPICCRCFLLKHEHLRLEQAAGIPPTNGDWAVIPVPTP